MGYGVPNMPLFDDTTYHKDKVEEPQPNNAVAKICQTIDNLNMITLTISDTSKLCIRELVGCLKFSLFPSNQHACIAMFPNKSPMKYDYLIHDNIYN